MKFLLTAVSMASLIVVNPTFSLGNDRLSAEQKMQKLRESFSSSAAPNSGQLGLGRLWKCDGVDHNSSTGWSQSSEDPFELLPGASHASIYLYKKASELEPRRTGYELMESVGLIQYEPAMGVLSLLRMTPTGELISETSVSLQFAETMRYKGLPTSLVQAEFFAVGYSLCKQD
jgi:hypothetical protein